jgi:branched-chain amino acid transport system permease protein
MLVLGGAGNLFGAIGGTAAFMLIHHTASAINPYHWLFIIGGLLVFVVLVPRAHLFEALRQRVGRVLPVAREVA